ncbi:CoA pyrophosphatase [Geopsychrobacter electrodiphilus]|uniref:CoA pyrophosphatase n=1 Tax=Geopsychrobacter electrodiphilus TaxID=225196 RepID=UPI000368BE4A|nr:CoA pyrophosphatase [Geopsychrobacter electrodiphilus]
MIAELKGVLAEPQIKILPQRQMRAAAVLVPLRLCAGELQLILTRRTDHLTHHAGEISFPGGGVEPLDDDDWATALRETREEIGVEPDQVEHLGRLNDCYSIHKYRVSCHVGLLPTELEFVVETGEIAELIELPLRALNNPQIYHQEDWQHRGRSIPVDFYTLDGYVIWGMTGTILKDLLQRLVPLLEQG